MQEQSHADVRMHANANASANATHDGSFPPQEGREGGYCPPPGHTLSGRMPTFPRAWVLTQGQQNARE